MKGKALLVAFVLLQLLIGCSEPEFEMAKVVAHVDPLLVGTVSALSPSDQCIYYIDSETGHVMRVSLDGEIRESVVECAKGNMIGLQPTVATGTTQGRLHLSSVPGGSGYTVLEVSAARNVAKSDSFLKTQQDAYLVNSDVKTKWTFTYAFSPFEIEPGHHHDYIEKVTFTDGSTVKTYDYVVEVENWAGFYGMADEDHVVLLDMPNIIVWNLVTDEKICIANVDREYGSAVVWPRDLHSEKRYTPIAKMKFGDGLYEWEMSDPQDFVRKDEYLKRKVP